MISFRLQQTEEEEKSVITGTVGTMFNKLTNNNLITIQMINENGHLILDTILFIE